VLRASRIASICAASRNPVTDPANRWQVRRRVSVGNRHADRRGLAMITHECSERARQGFLVASGGSGLPKAAANGLYRERVEQCGCVEPLKHGEDAVWPRTSKKRVFVLVGDT
jgi:hypothetical protein